MADDGVPALLLRLRAQIRGDSSGAHGSRVRSTALAFERLLLHRGREEDADADARVQRELARVRSAVGGGAAGVFGLGELMDRAVDACEALAEQERRGKRQAADAVPVRAAMRLLVALAGGHDGSSFVLRDPTRVLSGESAVLGQKRIGDKITMGNVDMLSQWDTLFERECVPLQDDRVLSAQIIKVVGTGVPNERAQLWQIASERREQSGFLNALQVQPLGNQFISTPLSSSSEGTPTFLNDFQQSVLASYHDENPTSLPVKAKGHAASFFKPPEFSDVFFWDGTQYIKHTGWKKTDREDDATSVTEDSSVEDSEDLADASEVWSLPRSARWESIGDQYSLPRGVNDRLPRAHGAHRGLHQLNIPNAVACRRTNGVPPVQVHEDDVIEGALQALCGVESVLYRRDIQTGTLQLPRRHHILLPKATLLSTQSVLEVFRKTGTYFIRLEFLGIYYSQDARRGGKSLQVFGCALLEYLSAHQRAVEHILEGPTSAATITSLLTRTRNIRRTLETVGFALQCDSSDFWALLVHRKFPRGLALLDFLHDRIIETEPWDSCCNSAALLRWLLKRTSAPFLSVLSDIMRNGIVDEATDPFDEFAVTRWTRELSDVAEFSGGDRLFSAMLEKSEASQMVPVFLSSAADQIVHLCRLQKLLRSLATDSSQWQELIIEFDWDNSVSTMDFSGEVSRLELRDASSTVNMPVGEDDDDLMGAVGEQHSDSSRVKLPAIHPFFSSQSEENDDFYLARAVGEEESGNESGAILEPLELVIDAGIVQHILRSVTRLDITAKQLFLETTEFVRHLSWIRKLALMAEGLCMDTFVRDILGGLHSSTTRLHWSSGDHLTSTLSLALMEARGEVPEFAHRFRYQTTTGLQAMLGAAMPMSLVVPQLVQDIGLVCYIQWPMGVVISSQSLTHYATIHRWLLHLRLTALEMKEVWALLRIMGRREDRSGARETREKLLKIVHQIQHVIRAFNESFCTMVLMASWTTLKGEIGSSKSLLDLRSSHDRYVETAMQSCYLDGEGEEIHKAFDDVLSCAWKTSELVRALSLWPMGLAREQERVRALADQHTTSRERLVSSLQSVPQDRPRGVRAFTESLLVCIDFNS